MSKETVICTCVGCTERRKQERQVKEREAKIATDRQKLKEHGIVYQN